MDRQVDILTRWTFCGQCILWDPIITWSQFEYSKGLLTLAPLPPICRTPHVPARVSTLKIEDSIHYDTFTIWRSVLDSTKLQHLPYIHYTGITSIRIQMYIASHDFDMLILYIFHCYFAQTRWQLIRMHEGCYPMPTIANACPIQPIPWYAPG